MAAPSVAPPVMAPATSEHSEKNADVPVTQGVMVPVFVPLDRINKDGSVDPIVVTQLVQEGIWAMAQYRVDCMGYTSILQCSSGILEGCCQHKERLELPKIRVPSCPKLRGPRTIARIFGSFVLVPSFGPLQTVSQ